MIKEQDLLPLAIVTGFSFLMAFIPSIVNAVIWLLRRESSEQAGLRSQLKTFENELKGMSMVDEFAKYAKIQRNMAKITSKLKDDNSSSNTLQIKIKLGLTVLLYLIGALCKMYIIWSFGSQPILMLPPQVVEPYYPLGFILAFPLGVKGAVGATSWIFISYFVAKKVVGIVTS